MDVREMQIARNGGFRLSAPLPVNMRARVLRANSTNRAGYTPSADCIEMLPSRQSDDTPTGSAAGGYYATLLHELVPCGGSA